MMIISFISFVIHSFHFFTPINTKSSLMRIVIIQTIILKTLVY